MKIVIGITDTEDIVSELSPAPKGMQPVLIGVYGPFENEESAKKWAKERYAEGFFTIQNLIEKDNAP